VFAAFHLDVAQLIPLVLVGLLFAYAYERTGSLWCSVAPHAGLNATFCLVLFAR
jgi:membrane protease YdiL (CAAX protease family)